MASPQLAAEHAQLVRDLMAVTTRDAVTLGRQLAVLSPIEARDALLDEFPALVRSYAEVGGTYSADWYDEVRSEARAAGQYRASVSGIPNDEQMQATARWAVGQLFSEQVEAFLRDLSYGATRLVQQPTRATIIDSAFADPASGAFVRVARPDACSFCLMLASRGAVYASQSTAMGTRNGYHTNCQCRAEPVFSPGDVPTFNRELSREWGEVTAGLSGKDALRAWDQHFRLTRTA
jgi:hypothetical protein